MIVTNGFPKSGNHALVKAVQLLGQPCRVQHEPFTQVEGPCVFIRRDPRNVLLSWVRHLGKPVVPGMVATHAQRFEESAAGTLADAMAPFEGWLSDAGVLVVSYEALTESDAEMRRIAAYLGVPYIDGAWQWLPGMTQTWHAQHSDWRSVWTADVQTAWDGIDGPALLQRWGY